LLDGTDVRGEKNKLALMGESFMVLDDSDVPVEMRYREHSLLKYEQHGNTIYAMSNIHIEKCHTDTWKHGLYKSNDVSILCI